MSKILMGEVVSAKMLKTVVVAVETRRPHPLYKKLVRKIKKYKAHNENFDLSLGDKVKIKEIRPVSKEKHFEVIEIIGG